MIEDNQKDENERDTLLQDLNQQRQKLDTQIEFLRDKYYIHESNEDERGNINCIVEDLEIIPEEGSSQDEYIFMMKMMKFKDSKEYLIAQEYYKKLWTYTKTPFTKKDLIKIVNIYELEDKDYYELIILTQYGETDCIDVQSIEREHIVNFQKNLCQFLINLEKLQKIHHGNLSLNSIMLADGDLKISNFEPLLNNSQLWKREVVGEYGGERLDVFAMGILWMEFMGFKFDQSLNINLENLQEQLMITLKAIKDNIDYDIVLKMIKIQQFPNFSLKDLMIIFQEKSILENLSNQEKQSNIFGRITNQERVTNYQKMTNFTLQDNPFKRQLRESFQQESLRKTLLEQNGEHTIEIGNEFTLKNSQKSKEDEGRDSLMNDLVIKNNKVLVRQTQPQGMNLESELRIRNNSFGNLQTTPKIELKRDIQNSFKNQPVEDNKVKQSKDQSIKKEKIKKTKKKKVKKSKVGSQKLNKIKNLTDRKFNQKLDSERNLTPNRISQNSRQSERLPEIKPKMLSERRHQDKWVDQLIRNPKIDWKRISLSRKSEQQYSSNKKPKNYFKRLKEQKSIQKIQKIKNFKKKNKVQVNTFELSQPSQKEQLFEFNRDMQIKNVPFKKIYDKNMEKVEKVKVNKVLKKEDIQQENNLKSQKKNIQEVVTINPKINLKEQFISPQPIQHPKINYDKIIKIFKQSNNSVPIELKYENLNSKQASLGDTIKNKMNKIGRNRSESLDNQILTWNQQIQKNKQKVTEEVVNKIQLGTLEEKNQILDWLLKIIEEQYLYNEKIDLLKIKLDISEQLNLDNTLTDEISNRISYCYYKINNGVKGQKYLKNTHNQFYWLLKGHLHRIMGEYKESEIFYDKFYSNALSKGFDSNEQLIDIFGYLISVVSQSQKIEKYQKMMYAYSQKIKIDQVLDKEYLQPIDIIDYLIEKNKEDIQFIFFLLVDTDQKKLLKNLDFKKAQCIYQKIKNCLSKITNENQKQRNILIKIIIEYSKEYNFGNQLDLVKFYMELGQGLLGKKDKKAQFYFGQGISILKGLSQQTDLMEQLLLKIAISQKNQHNYQDSLNFIEMTNDNKSSESLSELKILKLQLYLILNKSNKGIQLCQNILKKLKNPLEYYQVMTFYEIFSIQKKSKFQKILLKMKNQQKTMIEDTLYGFFYNKIFMNKKIKIKKFQNQILLEMQNLIKLKSQKMFVEKYLNLVSYLFNLEILRIQKRDEKSLLRSLSMFKIVDQDYGIKDLMKIFQIIFMSYYFDLINRQKVYLSEKNICLFLQKMEKIQKDPLIEQILRDSLKQDFDFVMKDKKMKNYLRKSSIKKNQKESKRIEFVKNDKMNKQTLIDKIKSFLIDIRQMMSQGRQQEIISKIQKFSSILSYKSSQIGKYKFIYLLNRYYMKNKESTNEKEFFKSLKDIIDQEMTLQDYSDLIMLFEVYSKVDYLILFLKYMQQNQPQITKTILNNIFYDKFLSSLEELNQTLRTQLMNQKTFRVEYSPFLHLIGQEKIEQMKRPLQVRMFSKFRYQVLINPELKDIILNHISQQDLINFMSQWLIYCLIYDIINNQEQQMESLINFTNQFTKLQSLNATFSLLQKIDTCFHLLNIQDINKSLITQQIQSISEFLKKKLPLKHRLDLISSISTFGNIMFKNSFYEECLILKNYAQEMISEENSEDEEYQYIKIEKMILKMIYQFFVGKGMKREDIENLRQIIIYDKHQKIHRFLVLKLHSQKIDEEDLELSIGMLVDEFDRMMYEAINEAIKLKKIEKEDIMYERQERRTRTTLDKMYTELIQF